MHEEAHENAPRWTEMIVEACKQQGLTIDGWEEEDSRPKAMLGRWVWPDEFDEGGVLTAMVVGSAEFHNERVMFNLEVEGIDGGEEVSDLSVLEPV